MSINDQSAGIYAACNDCFTYALTINGICWPCTRNSQPPQPAPKPQTQSMYDICLDMRRNRRLGRKSGW